MGRYQYPQYQITIELLKLFCEMNDIVLGWKKIARRMGRVRKAANDRAPTLEEIQRLIEYPDRRIKSIVYTMVSSGIRIGAGSSVAQITYSFVLYLSVYIFIATNMLYNDAFMTNSLVML